MGQIWGMEWSEITQHFVYFSPEGRINSGIPICHRAYFRKLESIKHFVPALTQALLSLIKHDHRAELSEQPRKLLVPGPSPFFPHCFPKQEPAGQWEVSLNQLIQLFEGLQIHRWYDTQFVSGAGFPLFFFDRKSLKECDQSWLLLLSS